MDKHQQQELDLKSDESMEIQSTETEELESENDSDSDVSTLLGDAITNVTGYMSEDEVTTYIASLFNDGIPDGGFEVENEHTLFENVTPSVYENIKVTNYRPDQAVREASLAQKHMWRPGHGEISYLASNTLEVYLGTPERPLEIPQALRQIRQLSESTVLTARIILGLWNIRRHNDRVAKNGSVAILLEEILQWQGLQKHSRVAHPGTVKRYTDGYRTEQKQRVLQDLALLASCNVRGNC